MEPFSLRQPRPLAAAKERLDSWKEIAAYLNRDVSTVRRWEQKKGLPVHRVPGGERDTIYALRLEIDRWWDGQSAEAARTPPRARPLMGPIAGAAALCVTIAAFALWIWLGRPRNRDHPNVRVTPLMTQPGMKLFPALSPDGRFVAFSWNGENQDNYDLYVKLLVAESPPIRITTDAALDVWPSWSPDGKHILFARWKFGSPKADYFITPALGGSERKLGESLTPTLATIPTPLAAWVQGGQAVIIPQVLSVGSGFRLQFIRLDTLETRELIPAGPDSASDCCPALSPDGRTVAFVRTNRSRISNIHLAALNPDGKGWTAGPPHQLTVESGGASNPAWIDGGNELLYVAKRDGTPALWRIPASGGAPAFVRSVGGIGQEPSVSVAGNRIAYSTFLSDEDIWSVDIGNGATAKRLIASTLIDRAPQPSPDGKRIAFLSTRSGTPRVWVSDAAGRNARDLAASPGWMGGAPSWSPDSREIAFECRFGENADICAASAEGGPPRRLTVDGSRDILPSWSRDGRSVYFTSDRGAAFRIWKVPARGEDNEHPAIRVTREVGYGAVESRDGYIYYTKDQFDGRIARTPVAGGEEHLMADSVRSLRMPQNFALAANGVYHAFSTDPRTWFEIHFTAHDTGKSTTLLRMQRGLGNGMMLSPDGRNLLFSAAELRGGDLMLVDMLN